MINKQILNSLIYQVKNETKFSANTALRVGRLFEGVRDYYDNIISSISSGYEDVISVNDPAPTPAKTAKYMFSDSGNVSYATSVLKTAEVGDTLICIYDILTGIYSYEIIETKLEIAYPVSASINSENHLIFVISNGDTIDAGVIPTGGESGIQTITISDRSELDSITEQGIYIIDGASHELLIVLNDDIVQLVLETTSDSSLIDFNYPNVAVAGDKIFGGRFSASGELSVFDTTLKTVLNHDVINRPNGICLAPDGFLYGISTTGIIKINKTDFTYSLTNLSNTGINRAHLLQNGKIIFLSYSKFVVFNPSDNSYTEHLTGLTGTSYASCLAEDGFVYMFPMDTNMKIIKINSATNTFDLIDFSLKIGSLVPIGNYIYCSSENETIVKYNTVDNTYTTFSGTNNLAITDITLAPNGKIYGCNLTHVYEIDIQNETVSIINDNTGINSYYKIRILNDSKIYCLPVNIGDYLVLSNLGTLTSSDYTIPTNLSTLATSNYNKYFNR